MNLLSEFKDTEELSINGDEVIKKFVIQNHRKFTIYQLTQMLGVTPGTLQDMLTPQQFSRVGSRAVPSMVIVRDMSKFDVDAQRFADGH